MRLDEAIKTRRRFRRKNSQVWFITTTQRALSRLKFSTEEALADDWEVDESDVIDPNWEVEAILPIKQGDK